MGELLEVGTEVYVNADGVEIEGRVIGHGSTRHDGCDVDAVYLVKMWGAGIRTALAGVITTLVAHPDCVRARVYVPAAELVEAPGCSGWCAECVRGEVAG